jgi:DNA-binding transcriptional ArsR family regulator
MRATAGRGWAYGGALLGGAVSVAANVAHSYVPPAVAGPGWDPHAGAVVGAVFWPVALFVAIEILARTPWPDPARWVVLRYAGLLPVALVAALVSYRHLAGLLAFYGEDPLTATLGPLAVDGLMVMATGALIATSPARTPDTVPDTAADTIADADTWTGPGLDIDPWPDTGAWPETDTGPDSDADDDPETLPAQPGPAGAGTGTAAAVMALRAAHPDLSAADIAARLGVSDRTVRRHLARATPTASSTVRAPLHLLTTPNDTSGGGDRS